MFRIRVSFFNKIMPAKRQEKTLFFPLSAFRIRRVNRPSLCCSIYTKILDLTFKVANIGVFDGLKFNGTSFKTRPAPAFSDASRGGGNVADVAELADAQASGACSLTGVEVRLLSSAFIHHLYFMPPLSSVIPRHSFIHLSSLFCRQSFLVVPVAAGCEISHSHKGWPSSQFDFNVFARSCLPCSRS
jgi:hypothetical protein